MIIVLHGKDSDASYARLAKLLESYNDYPKIRLDAKAQDAQIIQEVFTSSLFESKKLIVVENFLAPLKKLPKYLEKIPTEVILIFWEGTDLTPAKIKGLQKLARVEYFKQSTEIFPFLDSLYPGSKSVLPYLASVGNADGMLWQIQNRFLLLIVSKLGMGLDSAQTITKRTILDWQWGKIKNQTARFDLKTLRALLAGALKIDFMIKSGKTELSPNTLLSMLFLKYLK